MDKLVDTLSKQGVDELCDFFSKRSVRTKAYSESDMNLKVLADANKQVSDD